MKPQPCEKNKKISIWNLTCPHCKTTLDMWREEYYDNAQLTCWNCGFQFWEDFPG